MNLKDIFGDDMLPKWDDDELVISLESARDNLIALRKRHPDKCRSVPNNPKSGSEMLAKAKELHAKNKSASMMTISLESYADEFDLDSNIRVLLEEMSNNK